MKKLASIVMLFLFTVYTVEASSTPRNLSKRQLCMAVPMTASLSYGAARLAHYTFNQAAESSGLVLKSFFYGTSGTSAFVSIIGVGASATFAYDLAKKINNS